MLFLDHCTSSDLIRHHGQTYTDESDKYKYILVLGKSLTQKELSGSGSWLLGNYASGTKGTEIYDNGSGCGGDIKRQATIIFVQGEKTKLLDDKEPTTCNYEFVFQINCQQGNVLVLILQSTV